MFFQEPFRVHEPSVESIDEPFQVIFLHFGNAFLRCEVENAFGEAIAIYAFLPHEGHAHDGILILSGAWIHEVMVFRIVYGPFTFIAPRSGDGGVFEGYADIYDQREGIFYPDSPGGSFAVHSVSVYISPGVHKKIVVSESQ